MTKRNVRSPIVRPDARLQARVDARLAALLDRARAHFGCDCLVPAIGYRLRGTTAGRAYPRAWRIELNALLLRENPQDFLHQTVAHELAHLIAVRVFGAGIRPHGRQWQSVMRLFGVAPRRCHGYDVSRARVRAQARYPYRCRCATHALSAVRHQRAQGGAIYRCKRCRAPLEPVR